MDQEQIDGGEASISNTNSTSNPPTDHHPLLQESNSSHPLLGSTNPSNLKDSILFSSDDASSSSSSSNPISNSTRFSSLRQPQPTATRPNVSYFDLKGLTQRLEKAQVEAHEQSQQREESRQRELQNEKKRRRWTQYQAGATDSNLFNSELDLDQHGDGHVLDDENGDGIGREKGKGKERRIDSEVSEEDESDTLPQGVLTPKSSRSPAPLSPRARSFNPNQLFSKQNGIPARSFRDSLNNHETPKKRNGSSSKDSALSSTPQSISRGGTSSSFEDAGLLFSESSLTRQHQPLWENEQEDLLSDDPDEEEGLEQIHQGSKPPLDLLSSLHLMSDLEVKALSKSASTWNSQSLPRSRSRSQSQSQPQPHPDPQPHPQPQSDLETSLSSLLSLLRSTSLALSISLNELSSLRDDLASSEAESSSAVKSLQSKSLAREEVLRGICKERGGITEGEIQRALTRASAPVIEATPLKTRSKTAASTGAATPSRSKGKEREDEDANLLSSLQEAMLDDVSGNGQLDRLGSSPPSSSRSRSRSRSATPSNAGSGRKGNSSPGSRSSSAAKSAESSSKTNLTKPKIYDSSSSIKQAKEEDQDPVTLRAKNTSSKSLPTEIPSSSNRRQRSKSVSSSATTTSASIDRSTGGISGWASGFIPWGASSSSTTNDSLKVGSSSGKARAITQSTSPAEVEADGYMSPDLNPSSGTTDPTRSRSIPSNFSDEAVSSAKSAKSSRTVSTPSKSGGGGGGLGLLGSLAWRRKKTNPSMPKSIREIHDPPDLKPTSPLLSPTAVEREPPLSSYFGNEDSSSKDVNDASSQLSRQTSTTSPSTKSNLNHQADSTSFDSPKPSSRSTSPGVEVNTPVLDTKLQPDSESQAIPNPTPAARPLPSHTPSGREISSALYEAIGSPPLSPVAERLQAQLGSGSNDSRGGSASPASFPKPTHFKAIFLATRVMTSDPASIVYDSGKNTSESVAKLALYLVGRAREEGKVVDEVPIKTTKDAATSLRKVSSGVNTPTSAAGSQGGEKLESNTTAVNSISNSEVTSRKPSTSSTTAATLGRAFGRYKDSSTSPSSIQPNVTRLPNLYPYSSPSSKLPSKYSKAEKSQQHQNSKSTTPTSVELESMDPLDVKPPTFALFSRQNSAKRNSKVGGRLGSLSEGEEEESSGDEFEVYGGKGLVPPPAYSSAKPVNSREEDTSQLMTDRYGFVYDPADVKLLRQARKESTTAPACLTGIRVGVSARGVDEDEDEGKSGSAKENGEIDSLEEDEKEDGSESGSDGMRSNRSSASAARGNASIKTADSSIGFGNQVQSDKASTTSRTSRKSSASTKNGLLPVAPSKPVAEASALSVSSYTSLSSGPTSPSQEMEFSLSSTGSDAGASSQMDNSSNKSEDSPIFSDPKSIKKTRTKPKSTTSAPGASSMLAKPSISSSINPATSGETSAKTALSAASQTVKSLLGQLQTMHDKQQAEQQALWDDFLRRRREKEAILVSKEGRTVSVAATLRKEVLKSSQGAGILNSNSKSSDDPIHDPEEGWSSGLVGIARMGDHSTKSSRADWKEFMNLCQSGVPLIYRSKIWQECSGASEAMEPGRYLDLLKEHEGESNSCTNQIDLDVHRTMPTNVYFGGDGPGVPKLRRLLVAFSWWNPECGYCQGMNNLAATLLLTHATEEEAFWVLVCMIEKILPSEYYTSHLLVSQADQRVLIDLVDKLMPQLSAHMEDLGVDLPAVTFAWFLSLYTDCLPVETLFRVWDVLFVEGMSILFRIAIAILQINEEALLATKSPAAFYGLVHSMTSRLFSVDRLIKMSCGELKEKIKYEEILVLRASRVKEIEKELGLDGDGNETGFGNENESVIEIDVQRRESSGDTIGKK